MVRSGRIARGVALSVAVVLGLAACNPVFGEAEGGVRHGSVNHSGYTTSAESFDYSSDDAVGFVSAPPSNTDGNLREVFWDDTTPFYADQESCITWLDTARSVGGPLIQPGIALRIAPSGPEGNGIKAIAIEQNIAYGVTWAFWVHSWDSASTDYAPFTKSFDVREIVRPGGNIQPPPWHLCARTQGTQLRFKLWTGQNPEPAWDDPVHVFSAELPAEHDYAGYSGGYIGHVRAGQTARFTNQRSVPLCLAADMIDTPYCQDLRDENENPTSTSTVPTTTTVPVEPAA